jgi:hypothetical protein
LHKAVSLARREVEDSQFSGTTPSGYVYENIPREKMNSAGLSRPGAPDLHPRPAVVSGVAAPCVQKSNSGSASGSFSRQRAGSRSRSHGFRGFHRLTSWSTHCEVQKTVGYGLSEATCKVSSVG